MKGTELVLVFHQYDQIPSKKQLEGKRAKGFVNTHNRRRISLSLWGKFGGSRVGAGPIAPTARRQRVTRQTEPTS